MARRDDAELNIGEAGGGGARTRTLAGQNQLRVKILACIGIEPSQPS